MRLIHPITRAGIGLATAAVLFVLGCGASPAASTVAPAAATTAPGATAPAATTVSAPPTETAVAPTATAVPATNTSVPPTDTPEPPTVTTAPPTKTPAPPTATVLATAIQPEATATEAEAAETATDGPVAIPTLAAGFVQYLDPKGRFTIALPESWIATEADQALFDGMATIIEVLDENLANQIRARYEEGLPSDALMVAFDIGQGPSDVLTMLELGLRSSDVPIPLDELTAASVESLGELDIEGEPEASSVELPDGPASEIITVLNGPGDIQILLVQYLVIRDTEIYLLSYQAPATNADAVLPLIRQSALSFHATIGLVTTPAAELTVEATEIEDATPEATPGDDSGTPTVAVDLTEYSVEAAGFAISVPEDWLATTELSEEAITIMLEESAFELDEAVLAQIQGSLESNDPSIVRFLAWAPNGLNEAGNFTANVNVIHQQVPAAPNLADAVDEALATIQNLKPLGEVSSDEITVDGAPAMRFIYEIPVDLGEATSPDISAVIVQYLIIRDTDIYVITYAIPADRVTDFADAVIVSSDSFRYTR